MLMLYDHHNFKLSYDPRYFLHAELKGYFFKESFKKTFQIISDYLHLKKCGRVILDFQKVKGSFQPAIPWMENEFMPSAIHAGFEKAAIINSNDRHAQASIQQTLEVNDEYEAQLFEDPETAIEWITGQWKTDGQLPQKSDRLILKNEDKHFIIPVKGILYLQSKGKATEVITTLGKYVSKMPLKTFLLKLPPNFIQIHRSYIVNISLLSSVKHKQSGVYELFLKTMPNTPIPVSRKYTFQLKQLLQI